MLKTVGMIMIAIAVWSYFFITAKGIEGAVAQKEGFSQLLAHIKIMISAKGAPLCEIYSCFSNYALEKCGFCEQLQNGGYDALSKSVMEYKKVIFRDEALYSYAREFAEGIGLCGNSHLCVEHCEKYISLYDNRLSELSKSELSRAQLYKKLGMISAAFIILLFI